MRTCPRVTQAEDNSCDLMDGSGQCEEQGGGGCLLLPTGTAVRQTATDEQSEGRRRADASSLPLLRPVNRHSERIFFPQVLKNECSRKTGTEVKTE